ncbi:MAG TPA: hypothetical protein VH396_04730 [Chitinophagaceae bacterium]|jgi:hypothetical protein
MNSAIVLSDACVSHTVLNNFNKQKYLNMIIPTLKEFELTLWQIAGEAREVVSKLYNEAAQRGSYMKTK